jgi:hypothetical protein
MIRSAPQISDPNEATLLLVALGRELEPMIWSSQAEQTHRLAADSRLPRAMMPLDPTTRASSGTAFAPRSCALFLFLGTLCFVSKQRSPLLTLQIYRNIAELGANMSRSFSSSQGRGITLNNAAATRNMQRSGENVGLLPSKVINIPLGSQLQPPSHSSSCQIPPPHPYKLMYPWCRAAQITRKPSSW